MPNIPDLGIKTVNPVQVYQPHAWVNDLSVVERLAPPVTVEVGVPVVQIPGCVKAHPGNKKSNSIETDDPKGIQTFCDAGMPTFTPIDYTPENLIYSRPATFKGIKTAGSTDKQTKQPPSDLNTDAGFTGTNTSAANSNKDEEQESITCDEGYSLVEGKCVEVVEQVPATVSFTEKYLPTLPQATTTATIAVVATSSALLAKPLADLLLKLIKPTVKKIMKKIASLTGRSQKVESVFERKIAQRDRNRAILALRRALKK